MRDNPKDSIAPSPLPVSSGDAQTGLWRLSLVLKEISENLEPHTDKKNSHLVRLLPKMLLTGGDEGDDSRE